MRAQGSLEYLIIIAMVIAIIAIVASFVVNYFSTQTGQYYYASCSSAAATCKITLVVDPSNPCSVCDNACNLSNGTAIFESAATCCKLGKPDEIYQNTPGCVGCLNDLLCGGLLCCPTCETPPCPNPNECKAALCSVNTDCAHMACNDVVCSSPNSCEASCSYTPRICFLETPIADTPAPVMTIAIGDANNNLIPDIVAGLSNDYSGSYSELVLYENTSGGWVKTDIKDEPNTVEIVAVGDADNDGLNDIARGMWGAGGASILKLYKGQIGGGWTEVPLDNPSSYCYAVAIGDADNDTYNEIVAGYDFGAAYELKMYKYVAGGWVTTNIAAFGNSVSVTSVSIGDANNDGTKDIVVGLQDGSFPGEFWTLRMYQNDSGGWRRVNIYYSPDGTSIESPGNVLKVATGDVDRDGKNEVVAAIQGSMLRVYKNESGAWVQKFLGFEPAPIWSLSLGDANRDGYNEIVFGMYSYPTAYQVRMYNYTAGSWIESYIGYIHFSPSGDAGYAIRGIAVGDVNNDLSKEVVIGIWPNPGSIHIPFPDEIRMYTYY